MKIHHTFYWSLTEFIMAFVTIGCFICLFMAAAVLMDSKPKSHVIGYLIGAAVLLIIDLILLAPYLYV